MTEEDYRSQVDCARKTVELEENRTEFKRKLASLKKRTSILTANEKGLSDKLGKITRQLEIIDQLFHDPSTIDRVEEYNNPFAPGNFANLQYIALLLKAKEEESGKASIEAE